MRTPQALSHVMPSLLGHTLAGFTVSAAFHRGRPPFRVALAATACALAPDLDWFTGWAGLSEGHDLAHRGISHGLAAVPILAGCFMLLLFRKRLKEPRLWLCLGAATLSHGLLDAWTFGGTGVAFLAPFIDTRYTAAWQPLFVSPLPLSGHLLEWFLFALATELVWLGLPALLIIEGLKRRFDRPQLDREPLVPRETDA
ncbi:MAG: Inner membrane protein YbcI [Acidobacteria bacterium ADurb.Bin340]|nr:MAG: Inner membrane protein YbcI [Acidobacteria bacterium ADurb.Bin340]